MSNTIKKDRTFIQIALARVRRACTGPMNLTQRMQKNKKKEKSKRACRGPVEY